MEKPSVKRNLSRNESDGFLYASLVNPRFTQTKRWMEVMKVSPITKNEQIEPNHLTSFKEAEKTVLKELEAKLGICLPKETLEKTADFLKEKLSNIVTCSVFELHEFSHKILKILEKVENFGQSDWKIKLGSQEFLFKVSEEGCAKLDSFEFFKSSGSLKDSQNIPLPRSRIRNLNEYEEEMVKAFQTFDIENLSKDGKINKKLSQKSEELIKKEIKSFKKKQDDINNLKNDLEWQREELKFYKNEAKQMRNTKLCRESILDSEITNLREKRVFIAQSFEKIENLQEKFDFQKEKIIKILSDLQNFCENLGKPEVNHQSPTKLRAEILVLDSQLKDLELQFKKSSDDSLKLQINRLKTRISSLKAMSAISSTVTTTSSARSLMKSFNKVYSVSRLQVKSPAGTAFCSPLASNAKNFQIKEQTSSLSGIQVKPDRSLSVNQREVLEGIDKRKIENGVNKEVAQQQGKVYKKNMTPDEGFRIMKGDTKKIAANLVQKEEFVDGLTGDKVLFSTFSSGEEEKKEILNEKWKFWTKVQELKEILEKTVDEIVNN
jgi:hypothetical protein